jgi:16S rRNA (cytosine1402-N4)-methyltransferase
VADFAHESVLLGEVLQYLSPQKDGVYVDCTIGGGGHASAIAAAGGRVVGIDRDPAALEAARARLGDGATLVHGELGRVRSILADLGIDAVDGLLADLGVSSPQLDRPERGFSFTKAGPLDMRMDPTRGQTVLDLLHTTDVDTLGTLIAELGEERYAKRIARLVKEALREERIHDTVQLAAVIAKGIPVMEQRKSKIHPATRTFQALRIAVNAELDQLSAFLAEFADLLRPGGRCVIISFHSLEDRLVKNAFRDLTWTSSLPPRLATAAGERTLPVVELLTRKAVFATDEEVAKNPRARSARLRACMRTTAPNLPMRR